MTFKYTINDLDSFELNHIFDCGQCFRWNKQEDWTYTWVFWNNVLNVQKQADSITFSWIINWDNPEEIIYNYFDLNRDYNQIKIQL